MKLFRILFLAVTVVVSSCSSSGDDTLETDRSHNLAGTWRAIAYTIEGTSLVLINSDESSLTTFEGTGFEMDYTLFFGENPQSFSGQGDYMLEFFVTDENGQTTFSQGLIPVSANGTWSFANNRITFEENNIEQIGAVIELSDTRLKYQIATNMDEVDGSTSTSTNYLEIFTFERSN